MNKLGITLLVLMALAIPMVLGATTPVCTFLSSSTNATSESENATIMFGIQDTVGANMTNVTFTLTPGPSGNTSIYYVNEPASYNQSTPYFSISNVPDGYYSISALARYMNGTNGIYNENLTAMSSTCSGAWTIDTSEGGNTQVITAITDTSVEEDKGVDTLLLVIIIVVVAIFIIKRKK